MQGSGSKAFAKLVSITEAARAEIAAVASPVRASVASVIVTEVVRAEFEAAMARPVE